MAFWESIKLNPQLLKGVEEAGYKSPTPIQNKVIPLILGGQDVLGIAQTGTGKTAAYLLPILKIVNFAKGNDPRALILAPTKELAIQISENARMLAKYTDLRITVLYGGIGPQSQIKAIAEGVDILIATPGRFMEIYLRNSLTVKSIKTLVLDEADRMMDMGFPHQLRKIFEVIPSKRQNLLFSATFPLKVENFANEFLVHFIRVEITKQATVAKGIRQYIYFAPNLKSKINLLKHLLENNIDFNRVIIFTRTKEVANDVYKYIERKQLGPARVIHSNKGQNSRINALNEFKNGELRILVSTDVSARGIDVAMVSHVINFDVPIQYEDYVHRIGRTGRAFQTGEAITFVRESDRYHISKIEMLIGEKIVKKKFPAIVPLEQTPIEEMQEMLREIDEQKRKEDPNFKGAFHKKTYKKR